MKATIEIPVDLFHQVEAKSVLAGYPVDEIAVRLFSEWVNKQEKIPEALSITFNDSPQWFGVVREYAHDVKEHDIGSIRKSIAKGRYKP